MPKTLGSDLASLINSDRAWKVAKGTRSSSRRARKTIANGVKPFKEQGCVRAEEHNMPVSEPEKVFCPTLSVDSCGVLTSGCRFIGKAEHVPIKKRRFMFRSPSPPRAIYSPPVEETGLLTKSHEVSNRSAASESASSGIMSSQNSDTNISMGVKKPENSDGNFAGEDFSGISILATAACSSNIESCSNSLQENLLNPTEVSVSEFASSISIKPVGELASSSTSVDCTLELVADDKNVKPASLGVNSVTSSANVSCRMEDEMAVSQKLSSRDNRFHWDLNVVMDEWEDSLDDSVPHDDARYNFSLDAMTNQDGSYNKMTVTCAEKSSLMLDESKVISVQASGGSNENRDSGICHSASHNVSSVEKGVISSSNSNMDNVTYMVEDIKCTNPYNTKTTDEFVVHGSKHMNPPSMIEVYDTSEKKLNLNGDQHHRKQQSFELFKSTAEEPSAEVKETRGCSSVCAAVSAGVHDSEMVNDVCSMSIEASNSTSTICEHLIPSDTKVQDISNAQGSDLVCNSSATLNLSELPSAAPQKFFLLFDGTFKVNLDNHLNHSGPNENAELKEGVGVQDYTIPVAGVAAAGELQDYDSQYEDGEVRESNECSWEEYSNVDREAEEVEYRSTNVGECDVDLNNHHHDWESGQVAVSSVDLNVFEEVNCKAQPQNNNIDVGSNKIDEGTAEESTDLLSGTTQVEKSRTSSDMSVDDDVNTHTVLAHADGLVNSKATETIEEQKPPRRAPQSCVERPISRGRVFSDKRLNRTGNRFETGAARSFERGQYSVHNLDRGRHGGSCDGSSEYRRNFKCQYTSNFYPRPKLSDDSLLDRENFEYDGTQDDLSFPHHVHPNSRGTVNKEPGFYPRKYDRRFSPDRGEGFGRGRPFRYGHAVESREGRRRYNGPSQEESFQSSLIYCCPLSRRGRSFSPFGPRGQPNINHFRGNSPSRSRSRSPVNWNLPRGRLGDVNTFIRHRSRSPNFRSDGRTQRLRSPNQQPGFGADHAARFRPITRTQNSPSRNRWNSGRQNELGHLRDFGYKQRDNALHRSPGRIRLTGDRDSVIDSHRTLKPDGYNRISDRTSEAGGSRGLGYAENYDHRRKHYNFLRPARHSYCSN